MCKKILIFEDDTDTAECIGILADQLGFDIAYRNNTDNVLNDVLHESPNLIIMDNWISGLGGIRSIELLKNNSETAQIPIIFISANIDFESLAKTSKADAYLHKPFEIVDFEDAIIKLDPNC
ncbi:response regulator [Sphingobacterium oryzagri]|uniref:Response regulator n=1 Tax=Sphingobacterium oryzagri TaxID=3025669 RepID=A0ABY7WIC4_9SPHI|nr:response regulator [Sphingobacterium sp. KACC 22765]WDF67139.1 response regulator [Sphingobacterium sp. KACC 22765]